LGALLNTSLKSFSKLKLAGIANESPEFDLHELTDILKVIGGLTSAKEQFGGLKRRDFQSIQNKPIARW